MAPRKMLPTSPKATPMGAFMVRLVKYKMPTAARNCPPSKTAPQKTFLLFPDPSTPSMGMFSSNNLRPAERPKTQIKPTKAPRPKDCQVIENINYSSFLSLSFCKTSIKCQNATAKKIKRHPTLHQGAPPNFDSMNWPIKYPAKAAPDISDVSAKPTPPYTANCLTRFFSFTAG